MNSPEIYVPGRAWQKLLMAGASALLFVFGANELAGPLWLLVRGTPAEAEAWRVVRCENGQPDRIYTSDRELEAAHLGADRQAFFWNEFRFTAREGREIVARLPVGSQIAPIFSLRDPEGRPTRTRIFYSPARPEQTVFPGVIGTWFLPGMTAFFGLLGMVIGLTLFRNASRPISIFSHPHPDLHQPRA